VAVNFIGDTVMQQITVNKGQSHFYY